MGGGKSKARAEITNNQLIVNDTMVNMINKNIVDTTVNTIINNAKMCSASLNLNQNFDLSNVDVAGDIVIGNVKQDMSAMLNFTCLQQDKVRSDVILDVQNKLMDTLNRNISTDVLQKMDAAASSKQESGFLSMPGKSDSDAKITNNYTQISNTTKNLENVMMSKLVNNFTQSNISECIASINTNQNVKIGNLRSSGGGLKIGVIDQNIAANLLQSCQQLSDTAAAITNKFLGEVDAKVVDESKTSLSTNLSTSSTSSQKSTGPISELGNAISGILSSFLTSIFGAFGSVLAGILTGPIGLIGGGILVFLIVSNLFGGKSDPPQPQIIYKTASPVDTET